MNFLSKKERDEVNDVLKGGNAQIIHKGNTSDKGIHIIGANQQQEADLGVRVVNYTGKIFKRSKMCIEDGRQIIVAKVGDRYEDVNPSFLKKVQLSEADFE